MMNQDYGDVPRSKKRVIDLSQGAKRHVQKGNYQGDLLGFSSESDDSVWFLSPLPSEVAVLGDESESVVRLIATASFTIIPLQDVFLNLQSRYLWRLIRHQMAIRGVASNNGWPALTNQKK